MTVVYDRPDVALLPARRRFALARLIAYVRARGRTCAPDARRRVALTIDRDQDAAETYFVALWYFGTAATYVTLILPFPLPFAIVASVLITPWLVQIPFYISGGAVPAFRSRDNRTMNSVILMSLLAAASAVVSTMATPARFVAYFFFAVLGANALAFTILWLLRAHVREVEARCGA